MSWLRANRLSAKDPLNSPSYELNMRSSVDVKTKNNRSSDFITPQKIRSNPSFSHDKVNSKTLDTAKTSLSTIIKRKQEGFKLPSIKKNYTGNEQNPENKMDQIFYQSQIYRALNAFQTTYMMSLARQHFHQTIQALRITKNLKVPNPRKQIKLEKKSSHKKTVYLDLDQTLIHTDQRSQNYSVLLSFPIEMGGVIKAGVRIRPHCKQFLEELATFAEIIIFTASSASYANVILDHLDPEKKLFAHRLYRQHCTLQKGFYVKDLRVVNRKLQDAVIVDNSAFSFALQPENGIPILPYYHFNKDRQLKPLINFLREVTEAQDSRKVIKSTFFWDIYLKDHSDPKRLFIKKFKKNYEDKFIP